MTQFYDIDTANAAVPEVERIVRLLGDQRTELVRLRDEVLAQHGSGEGAPAAIAGDLRLTRLRMQGLIDQMAAGVARIDAMGLTLRDIEQGLVDFPALASGQQVWLCWQLGEEAIGWWHGLDTGFSGRKPLIDLD